MIIGEKVELRPVSLDDYRRAYAWRNDEESAKLEAGAAAFLFSHVPMEYLEDTYKQEIIELDKREKGRFSIYTRGQQTARAYRLY